MRHKALIALLAMLTIGRAQAEDDVYPVMVELFTSQGCSSCPPADTVLSKLAQRSDVLALSFHVDYWDSLGWKDPFASPLNTARQKAYRVAFHNAQIYTPQMVIGGVSEMVGQNGAAVSAAVADVARHRSPGPRLTLRRDGPAAAVMVAESKTVQPATVWVAAYAPRHETAVRRGENAGVALANTNVVRKLVALGPYSGAAIHLPLPPDFAQTGEGIAAWLQIDPTGAILSASNAPPPMSAGAR